MSAHGHLHAPVGGRLMTPGFVALLAVAALGGVVMLWRFFWGLGSVSALTDAYPWGVWISIDVVVGTALGCGGYAVALLVYILNKGHYHPLVRPAVLTSLLGYGLAVIAVTIDLGRFWELWKVPVFFWRWSHSPQLEVALCVAAYVGVLALELSPAFFEKWRDSVHAGLRAFSRRGLTIIGAVMPWLLALGLLLPSMHQSSLGTMMLLPGSKLHPLWFTPWLPFLFLVNCIVMGYAIVAIEATLASRGFRLPSETSILASLGLIAGWLSMFWVAFRIAEVAWSGKLALIASGLGGAFLLEILLHLAGAAILLVPSLRVRPEWQMRAAILLVVAGAVFRINTYLVAFQPGRQFSYFPAVPELLITFGIIALEIALYIAAVKRFPILSGAPAAAQARS